MDRIWQWAWDPVRAEILVGDLRGHVPRGAAVLRAFVVCRCHFRGVRYYVEAAAVTVLATLVLVFVKQVFGLDPGTP